MCTPFVEALRSKVQSGFGPEPPILDVAAKEILLKPSAWSISPPAPVPPRFLIVTSPQAMLPYQNCKPLFLVGVGCLDVSWIELWLVALGFRWDASKPVLGGAGLAKPLPCQGAHHQLLPGPWIAGAGLWRYLGGVLKLAGLFQSVLNSNTLAAEIRTSSSD